MCGLVLQYSKSQWDEICNSFGKYGNDVGFFFIYQVLMVGGGNDVPPIDTKKKLFYYVYYTMSLPKAFPCCVIHY